MSITITIPNIKQETIDALEAAQQQKHETVTHALAAIRTKYAPLAKHAGFIRIAHSGICGSNYKSEEDKYYERNDKRVHALLCSDGFDKAFGDQNSGTFVGSRLYLTENSEWLQITRTGSWSAWQGTPIRWECNIKLLSDTDVEREYSLEQIIDTLSGSLTDLAQKIPSRMTRVQNTASLAARLLAALKD